MTIELENQTDYTASAVLPAEPKARPDETLYASEDGVVASLSNSEVIFQVRRTGAPHVMTFQVLQAVDQTREFRTLDEHVARVVATVPGLQEKREAVGHVLQNLAKRELLVSDRDFLARVSNARAREPAPVRAVFIRACDRPEQVASLFATLADYERRFRANRHYVLIDDSTTQDAINRHRDMLRDFARAIGCKLTYIGPSERSRLIETLARAVPEAAKLLPSLLDRPRGASRFGGGRAWNLALLLSAGARMVLLDDDQRLRLRKPEGVRGGLDPDPSAPAYVRFFRNMENALGAGEEIEGDPFELHLDVAGRSLGALASTGTYGIDRTALRGLSLSRLDYLQADAPILATQHGTYGSSRTESGAWLYRLAAAERAEFVQDRDSYLRNVEAGSIWYGYRQARAMSSATFTPFALDNSSMLPCTNPIGRGEDALFSRVTRLCHPDSLALELPVAIGHVQEGQRSRSAHTLGAHTPRFNYFVGDYVQRQLPDFHSDSAAQRLQLLAAHLRDIGGAGPQGCLRQLHEYLAYARADLIESMQHQYDAAPNAPIYWQADVRSIIETNGRALIARGSPRLGDWPADADADFCARQLQIETSELAGYYEVWPALWAHAREQGARLLGAV